MIVSILLGNHLMTLGQTTVRGKVIDATHQQGIGFVTVRLVTARDSTPVKEQVTDSSGRFELLHTPNGQYLLQLSSLGYQPLHKTVSLTPSVQPIVELGSIALTPDPNLLNEVVVNGSKPAFQRTGDRLVMNIAGNRFFKTATNVLDIFRKVPGLEVGGDGALLLSGRITPAVFIDGKPVPMSPEELQNYLTSLSPEMIESVELITNPSAQYDAEHKAIIDIKLKRDKTLGWRGNLNTNIQQNAYTYVENNFLLTYKTKKLTYTARLGYTGGTKIYRYSALQHHANKNILTTRTPISTRHNNFNYQLGADYFINKDHRIEVQLRVFQTNRKAHAYNTLYTTDSSATKVISHTNTNNYNDPGQDNYAANLNYITRLGKSQLQVQGSLVTINNRQQEDIQTRNPLTSDLLFYWKTQLKNDIFIRTVQADLSGNIGKGKWNAGVRFAFTTTKNDLRYDTLSSGGKFELDSGRTNSFFYDEYITAGYASYERKFNKLTLRAGLRAEHTHSIANAVTLKEVTDRNYLTWLPSVSFTYAFNQDKQLLLSYSRRITRPNFTQLNPFRFYLSPLNYVVGNPYLQPSTTNTLNISYTQKAFTVAVSAGRETDPMTRYPEYDPVTNFLEYLGTNLPYNDFASIEISFPLTITKWWRMSHTIGGYYLKELTPYHGVNYAIPIKRHMINGSQVFTLPKRFTFDISYNYRYNQGSGLYIIRPIGNVDLGLQKTWLNGMLNTKLNFYDIFNTYEVYYIFREQRIINNRLKHWFGNRRLALTLSYNFGRSTHTAKQSSRNEEENRAL